MRKPIKHVRHQAKKHHEAHVRLKTALEKKIEPEKLMGVFFGTFIIAIATLIIFFNWSKLVDWMSHFNDLDPEDLKKQQEEQLKGEVLSDVQSFEIGMYVSRLMNDQAKVIYDQKIQKLPPNGFELGLKTTETLFKKDPQTETEQKRNYLNSIIVSQKLGNGEHLVNSQTQIGSTFLKTILTSYYLGEKTDGIDAIIKDDAELFSKMNNALKTDVFAYLNQSNDRADSLDDYLNLLKTLYQSAETRSGELESQINFLSSNFRAQEETIGLTEDTFFENLEDFDGENANQSFTEFTQLAQEQSEIKAKVGAYQKLQDYYNFYLPQLDNRIRAIEANRDALIAGVRVTEIEGMELPIIIREE